MNYPTQFIFYHQILGMMGKISLPTEYGLNMVVSYCLNTFHFSVGALFPQLSLWRFHVIKSLDFVG